MYRRHEDTMDVAVAASGRVQRVTFFRSLVFICSAAMSILVFLPGIWGCGKKAMPSPPGAEEIPAVADLSHDIQGDVVFLTWTLPGKVGAGAFGEGDMVLSRARTRSSGELCEDCPQVFQRVAVLPIPETRVNATQTHFEKIMKGFRYTYRIELYMNGGRKSAASNLVTFDY